MHFKIRRWVKIVIFFIVVIVSLTLYSRYLGTKGIVVKEYKIVDSSIPECFYGYKIVHISDIHYKVTTNYEDLNKIVNEINLLKPDIVIFTGDLFDKNINYTEKDYKDLIDLLSKIDYNVGKYAIKGEHDLNDNWEDIISKSDFTDLNDNYDLIYNDSSNPILILGINSNDNIENTVNDIYSKISIEYKYSILILHEPDFIDKIDFLKFNLILAGHSHGGQIRLPFNKTIFKFKYSNKYYDDYYKIKNTNIYISSGIGTTKYKFRFLNKPSINLYRLRNK